MYEIKENEKSIFQNIYDYIHKNCVTSRETSLALTKIEEASFWLEQSITRNGIQQNSKE